MPPSLPLNDRTLAHHGRRVAIPTYDRGSLRRGVVHISVGSFHRAHQAVYFDALARSGLGDGWALTGVGMHRRAIRDALEPQDGLYTVCAREGEGEDARVIGIITRYLFAPQQSRELLEQLTSAATRLVTLTITPHGYASGRAHPHDARGGSPGVAALIVEALERRRRLGISPFTVLSCDNLADNGGAARAMVLSGAAARSPRLADWIATRGAFPSSMVDRITPGTTTEDRGALERMYGLRDRWPVVTEPFSQWVIEDRFCAGRPRLEEVGVQFVDDVFPYILRKTRLLNAIHCALGYLGLPAGLDRVCDAIADPLLGAYAEHVMDDEIAPLLPGTTRVVTAYASCIRARLANVAISDPLARLCRNGSAKVPAHLLSSIVSARHAGRPHPLLTLAVAAWCRLLRGGCRGAAAVLDDPEAQRLRRLAGTAEGNPRGLLADRRTFGALDRCPRFAADVTRDLRALEAGDVRSVIAARLSMAELAAERAA